MAEDAEEKTDDDLLSESEQRIVKRVSEAIMKEVHTEFTKQETKLQAIEEYVAIKKKHEDVEEMKQDNTFEDELDEEIKDED